MRFHIVQLTTYFPDRDPPLDVYFQQILEQVALAEELGWECFWFTEHHFIPYGGLIANPAVMMAAAAAPTSRIRLGSSISILPMRHPVQTARIFRCQLGSETWNWQFRGDPPPTILLRQTWQRLD